MKKSTKKQKFQMGEPILVTWRDTSGAASWASLHEPLPEPPHVDQLGFYISSDKDTLYICQGLPFTSNPEDSGCQILAPTSVPMGCVVEIRRMRPGGRK